MKNSIKTVWFSLFIKMLSVIKVSCAVGTSFLWLSGPAIFAPLAGVVGGLTGSFVMLLIQLLGYVFFAKTLSLSSFAFLGIPTFCASLYLATQNKMIRVALPLFCMALFIAHPVGSTVFGYSFYWLIPVIVSMLSYRTFFLESLGSTFVAHAVGTVIWLYTVPMTTEQWMSLAAIVAGERLLFALLMTAMYRIICVIRAKVAIHDMCYLKTVVNAS